MEFTLDSFMKLIREGHADVRLRDLVEVMGTDNFTYITQDALHLALAKGYKIPPQNWRQICRTKPVTDFKTHNEVRLNDFTTLSTVAELQAYDDLTRSDEEYTFSVVKYGNTVSMSMELRANDQLKSLATTVERMGAAAARTIEDYVFDTMLDDNPTIYDSNSLFDSSNHANDAGSTYELSTRGIDYAVQLMQTQTDTAGNTIDLVPRILIVPPALAAKAKRLIGADNAPVQYPFGATTHVGETTPNLYRGAFDLIVSPYMTTQTAGWYLCADPSQCEMLTMGFLNGNESPEILQEQPNTGHSFEYDAVRYKVRYIFGGAWGDWRGIVRGGV